MNTRTIVLQPQGDCFLLNEIVLTKECLITYLEMMSFQVNENLTPLAFLAAANRALSQLDTEVLVDSLSFFSDNRLEIRVELDKIQLLSKNTHSN